MTREVTLLRGDGIGPEVVDAAVAAVEAAGAKLRWVEAIAGAQAVEKHGTTLPQETVDAIKRTGVGLKGPIGIITERASLRIAEFAFSLAEREGRKRVTAIHKANIMKLGDGLFLRCCQEVAARHPAVKYDEMIIDNTCMQLVLRPQQFDIL